MSEMVMISLTHGQVALVDTTDADRLRGFNWRAKWNESSRTYYAMADSREGGKRTFFLMHRVIMGLRAGDPRKVDHQNGNGLDNRRINLRIATNQQNCCNSRPKRNLSGFKGVTWHQPTRQWRARIGVGYQRVHLGLFPTAESAHAAYCEAAKRLHGEFARTA